MAAAGINRNMKRKVFVVGVGMTKVMYLTTPSCDPLLFIGHVQYSFTSLRKTVLAK